jgi:hypothetical protein
MKPRHIYLSLCIVGSLVPSSLIFPWLLEHGLSPQRFVQDMFANGVSAFFGMDVVLSAVTLGVFVFVESARLRLNQRWLPILATLVVGVSLGLPLFLYRRQLHLDFRPARALPPQLPPNPSGEPQDSSNG